MAYLSAAASSQPVHRQHTSTKQKAFDLIRERSFFRGRYVLASGAVSDYYLDMKPTMLSPAGASALARLVVERLEDVDVDYIGGLVMGAVPLISNVALVTSGSSRPIPAFFVRQNVKDHGTKKLIEGLGPEETLAGKNVVILDDVTTKGDSAMQAVNAAQAAGARIMLVLSVVDREEGAANLFAQAGIPFAHLFTASEFLRAT